MSFHILSLVNLCNLIDHSPDFTLNVVNFQNVVLRQNTLTIACQIFLASALAYLRSYQSLFVNEVFVLLKILAISV